MVNKLLRQYLEKPPIGSGFIYLIFDTGLQEWVYSNTNLDHIDDINISNPVDGNVLVYQGGEWINAMPGGVGSGDNLGNHTATQNLDLAGYKLIGVVDGSASGEVATWDQLQNKTDIGHQHVKSDVTNFIESEYVHSAGYEAISGIKDFQGTILSTNLQTRNSFIVVNAEETGSGITAGVSGIEVNRGTSLSARLFFDETDDKWKVGYPVGSATAISLEGHIHNNISLSSLNDVDASLAPFTGSVLKYDGTKWAAGVDMSGSSVSFINDLTDVSLSSTIVSGDMLVYRPGQGGFVSEHIDQYNVERDVGYIVTDWVGDKYNTKHYYTDNTTSKKLIKKETFTYTGNLITQVITDVYARDGDTEGNSTWAKATTDNYTYNANNQIIETVRTVNI